MRIEVNKHPAATHITDVLVNGVPLQRGTCRWVDLQRGEACVYRTDGNGQVYTDGDNDLASIVITGAIAVRIPEEHRHMLAWGTGQ